MELTSAGFQVTGVDVQLHGQEDVAEDLRERGIELIVGDIRDPAIRARALEGVDAVVHLAAIVGDPACARDPDLARSINVEGTRTLVADAKEAGVERFVFASTCSNYGRLADPDQAVDETAELRPVSLYAEQKVEIERSLLADPPPLPAVTCLRFATLYGAAPRMRFDLTVNEFTRDLWAGRPLEVFGELFWRPYVHVADGARAIRAVIEAPAERVAGEVFNVGRSDENYRKLDIVERITERIGERQVSWVHRDEDPRDYKVSFEKVRSVLGFMPESRVPDGIDEIVRALDDGAFGDDPFAGRFSNISSAA
jgi:nucleoside-diphosphate-sugar epimerase